MHPPIHRTPVTIRLHELSAEAQQDRETLLTLIRAFTYRHEALTLEGREFPGLVEWKLRGAASDQGHLVGKKGSHAQALAFIAKKMGSANGTQYRLSVMEPEEGKREEQEDRPWATELDCEDLQELVTKVLGSCGLDDYWLACDVVQTAFLTVTLSVHFRDHAEADRMTSKDRNGMSLEASLGTILRAVADVLRVKIQLTVEAP